MLGYFLGRIFLFMKGLGIDESMIRFRQHLSGEMAHYACDCWDTELLCSYGWIECVGLADRSAYDLNAHTKGSGVNLVASRVLEKPEKRKFVECKFNKAILGKKFKKDSKKIISTVEEMSNEELLKLKEELDTKGTSEIEGFSLTPDMVKEFKEYEKNVQEEKFTPNVIEPSFGIGRIIYCLLE